MLEIPRSHIALVEFLDDLPEILDMLPEGMTRIQFAPGQVTGESHPWPVIGQWRELPNLVL